MSQDSKVENVDCQQFFKGSPWQCGKCKTARLETFREGGKETKGRAGCSDCNSGFPSNGYKEVAGNEKLPDGFDFGSYCNFLPMWAWFVIIGVVLLGTGLTVFLLRDKLPCLAKRQSDFDENLNPNSSQDTQGGMRH